MAATLTNTQKRAPARMVAAQEKEMRCKTLLPLLKHFNRSSPGSLEQLLTEQKHKDDNENVSLPADPTLAASAADSATSTREAEKSAETAGGGEAIAADEKPVLSGKNITPSAAVIIATASSRRITLCRTTLGLEVTSIPSSYEEAWKKTLASAAAPNTEEPAPTVAEEAVPGENIGEMKKEKLQTGKTISFSDEELLQYLGDEFRHQQHVGTSGVGTRKRRNTRMSEGSQQLMALKLYALRMALGKASSVAQQLWDDIQERETFREGKNVQSTEEGIIPDKENYSCSTTDDNNASSEGVTDSRENEAGKLPAGCVVIGADTIVETDGQVQEKATDEEEAKQMLLRLSGRTHNVHTAVCIFTRKEGSTKPAAVAISTTRVSFVDFSEEDVEAYVKTKEFEGKSGSYGILELAGQFVKSIDGCFFTVMGLPVQWVSTTLANLYHGGKIV